ncbi:MAG TPA: HAMP domain-containing sensor histidine kinase [Candidatus Krumholzibacteria bacterium]|nr:HAMP domain-containing sensor histidine kinase [Candidatus Krumholzibacteria bacterium]HPD71663.1 HAMP domain-containing sensor histidine kinase [Candidatus Krumholzibacteria bacterium]HRY41404.1 HAMP domain-containing sensor histidine kinase [Candidatus Krumholzibacteria bacterium]
MDSDSWSLLLHGETPPAIERDGPFATLPAASVPLALCDEAGRLVRWTEALAELLGEANLRAGDAIDDVLARAGAREGQGGLRAAGGASRDVRLGTGRTVRVRSCATRRGGCVHVFRLLPQPVDRGCRREELQSLVAHELRSPLAVIQGYAGLLATGQPGPLNQAQREFLGGIESQVAELVRRLDCALDLQRLDAGTLILRPEAVAIGELAARVLADHRRNADARHVRLGLQVQPEDLTARADPERLRLVLDSLVARAIQASPVGGWVRCEAVAAERFAAIAVADGGPALATGDEERLFEPAGGRDAPGRVAGTSIGLVVSRLLVERLGGTVSARGDSGVGTTIVVRLPRAERPGDRAGEPA